MARQRPGIAEEDPGRLARRLRGRGDMPERVEVGRIVEPAGDPEAVRQVGRADEEDVDAVDGGDLGGVLDGARRLDLDDPQDPPVDRLDVRVTELAEPGASGREREPAAPVGRVAHPRDRLARLLREVDARDHDPVRAEIEGTADAQPLTGLRPDERGGPRGTDRVEVRQELGFGADPVFEVDDQPVEAGARDQLGGHRRAEPGERAEQRLPGTQSVVQVDDARDGREGGGIGHGVHDARRAALSCCGCGRGTPRH